MFTGIIQTIGAVVKLTTTAEQNGILEVSSPIFVPQSAAEPSESGSARLGTAGEGRDAVIGDSIAVNGVCLTITALSGPVARFDLASETVRRTALSGLAAGAPVNLERALRFGDRFDGHFVQGHVDAVSEVVSIESEGQTRLIRLRLVDDLRGLIAPKGSIAIDGVSLTVGSVDGSPAAGKSRGGETFSVYIIPHTAAATIAGGYRPGSRVNLEADCIARYVARSVAVLAEASGRIAG